MRRYTKRFRFKEHFPINKDEVWNVLQGNRVVETWRVEWCDDKNHTADIFITEYEEDENVF